MDVINKVFIHRLLMILVNLGMFETKIPTYCLFDVQT